MSTTLIIITLLGGAFLFANAFFVGFVSGKRRRTAVKIPIQVNSAVQMPRPNRFLPGTKVVARAQQWEPVRHATAYNQPEAGKVYVVRQGFNLVNGQTVVSLVGVTAMDGTKVWEPVWSVRGFETLDEARRPGRRNRQENR